MKLKHLLPIVALGLPLLAAARPATPGAVKYTNPDGTQTEIYLIGDENFSIVTDGANRILELDSRGFWQQAVRNGKALTMSDADIALLRAEQPEAVSIAQPSTSKANRMAALDSQGRSKFPTLAEGVHSPVVLVEYSDTPFTVPNTNETFNRMLNETGFSDYGACGSARDYFEACSNGQFTPVFDVYGPVKVSQTSEYCVGAGSGLSGQGKNARIGEAFSEALKKLEADGVDFSKYDYDDDGVIDNIFFFYSGYGQADSGIKTTVWPHQSDFLRFTYSYPYGLGLEPLYFGGKRFGPYACSNELNYKIPLGAEQPYLDGIGAFTHEFGHVLGLPDLYDSTWQSGASATRTKTPGTWDNMDQGTYNDYSTRPPLYSAYEQWLCRWLEFEDAEDATHYDLPTMGSADRKAIRLRVRRNSPIVQYTNEFFILESRGKQGWDEAIPGEGLLVWRVNYNASDWASNTVNAYGVAKVEILGCKEDEDMWTYPSYDGRFNSIYPTAPGGVNPSISTIYFRCFVADIKFDEEKQISSFDYNFVTEQPTDVTVLHDNPTKAPGNLRRVNLRWDAAEGATGYAVTVKRYDSAGREYIVDGYDEKVVGNVTECVVSNISSAAFKQNFKAYVRVIRSVPSVNTSNVIEFVPNDLAVEESGVATISSGLMQVRGLRGGIEAPEGAEIYNLGGVRTGAENLPAGIYLVKWNNEVVKVVVR